MKPYFSVVIPLYNKERHVVASIESVQAQSFDNFEIIVVNDGSTDQSLNVVTSISDSRLQIYTIENQGVSHARNHGVSKSKSGFVCFLDADDIWHSHHLEDIKHMIETYPNSGMYCKAYNKKIKNKIYNCHYNTKIQQNRVDQLKDYFKASFVDSIAYSSSIMIPKTVYEAIDGFDESIDSGEDTDMWIRLASQYPVCFYNKISVTINQDADNRISQKHVLSRRIMDLNTFETIAADNPSLKHYLDLNRFSLGMQSKLNGEQQMATNYLNEIDITHLTGKQRFLMASPRLLLIVFKKAQNLLRSFSINLSSYR